MLDQLVVAARVAERSALLFVAGGLEESSLHRSEQLVDRSRRPVERDLLLLARVATHDGDRCRREVAGAELDAERHALQLPLVELEPGPVLGPVVDPDTDARRPQLVGQGRGGPEHPGALVLAEDRHDHDLLRRDARRQPQPAVVAVRHHHAADQAGGGAPGRRVRMLLAAVARGVADAERAREALPEVVRGRRLQRLPVAHQRFERVGVDGAGEALALALAAAQHRDREDALDRVGVDVVQDRQRLGNRLLLGLVRRVPLLPEELARAQEEARPQLPADDVRPLVVEQRQVTVRLHPAGIRRPDQRLRGGTHDERLLELLPARLRDHGDLGCEALRRALLPARAPRRA